MSFTEKDKKAFKKLYEEAANISPEAVDFLETIRSFERKGTICFRSAESMRKKLYAKYPEHKSYTDDEAKEAIDAIAKAAKDKAIEKKKPQKTAATENTNSENKQ